MNIAKAISDMRNMNDLTQDELAAMLFVSRDLVSKWENGTRRPGWEMIEKMAEIFNVSPNNIVDKSELVYKELKKCLPNNCRLSVDELTSLLNSFLGEIDESEADIFVHRYYFLDSITDIAACFNMKENHIRTTLSRTRKKFRKHIKEVTDE